MIDINKTYRTRNGRPVRILCTDRAGDFPVVALVGRGKGEALSAIQQKVYPL